MLARLSFVAAVLVALLTMAQMPLAGFPPGAFSNKAASDPAAGGGGYSGPGDTIASATDYWGFNAYNAAYIGSKAANICDISTGTTCNDANIQSNGYISNALSCTGGCEVAILYGQVGGFNLAAPHGSRPVLTNSALGSFPCATFTTASSEYLYKSTFTNVSLPFTFSSIVAATALNTGTAQTIIGASTGAGGSAVTQNVFRAGAAEAAFQNHGFQANSATLSNGTFYALQGVANSTNVYSYANGAQVAASSTGVPIVSADPVFVGDQSGSGGSQFLGGEFCGGGLWPIDFANTGSDAANMNTQMRGSFGGF